MPAPALASDPWFPAQPPELWGGAVAGLSAHYLGPVLSAWVAHLCSLFCTHLAFSDGTLVTTSLVFICQPFSLMVPLDLWVADCAGREPSFGCCLHWTRGDVKVPPHIPVHGPSQSMSARDDADQRWHKIMVLWRGQGLRRNGQGGSLSYCLGCWHLLIRRVCEMIDSFIYFFLNPSHRTTLTKWW